MGKVKWTRTRWGTVPHYAREPWLAAEKKVKGFWELESEQHFIGLEEYAERVEVYDRNMKQVRRAFTRNKMLLRSDESVPRMNERLMEIMYWGSGLRDWLDVIEHFDKCFKDNALVHPSLFGWFDYAGNWVPYRYPLYRYGKKNGWFLGWVIHPMAYPIEEPSWQKKAFSLTNMLPVPKCLSGFWRPRMSLPEHEEMI